MSATKVRRVVGRTCLLGASGALLAAFAPWPAWGQSTTSSSTRPRVFTAAASATAIEFFPDRATGFTIPEAARVRFVAGDSGTSQSGGPTARSSVADPGGGATKGPSQICGLAGGPVSENLPQLAFVFDACFDAHWPFTVEADDLQTDMATAGATDVGQPSGPIYGQAGSAHARVDTDNFGSSTESVLGGVRLNPLPGGGSTGLPLPAPGAPTQGTPTPVDPSVFDVGSLAAKTSNVFEGTTLVSHGESQLQNVHLLGGLVAIDSIATVAESRSADGAAPVGTSTVTVQGVTVAGQRAGIGSDGVTFGDSGGGDPNQVNSSLNDALNQAGVSIKLIGATQEQDASGLMKATAQGLEVTFAHPFNFDGTPLADLGLTDVYTAKLVLGASSAGDLARNVTPIRRPIGGASTIGSATGTNKSGLSTGNKVGSPQATQQPAAATGGDESIDGEPSSFLGIDPGRIKFLYASFTLVALALCVSPALTLPHRLPGRGS